MRNMIDLICLVVYLISLNFVFTKNSIVGLLIVLICTMIYYVNFIKLREKNAADIKGLNEVIKKQQEYFKETLKHDLKIPAIAQLRGVEILKQGTLGEIKEEQREILEQIEHSCKYSLDMISMLLNGEYEEYKLKNSQIVNFIELLDVCINELKNEAASKNVLFIRESLNENIFVNADIDGLKQVFVSLLADSLEYSKNGENIYIKLNFSNNKISIKIKNQNKKSKVFTTVGESIRLSFCKRIIEFNSGQVFHTQKNNILGFELPVFSV